MRAGKLPRGILTILTAFTVFACASQQKDQVPLTSEESTSADSADSAPLFVDTAANEWAAFPAARPRSGEITWPESSGSVESDDLQSVSAQSQPVLTAPIEASVQPMLPGRLVIGLTLLSILLLVGAYAVLRQQRKQKEKSREMLAEGKDTYTDSTRKAG